MFDEAVSRFEAFLRQNGYPTELVWVEPADLVLPGRRAIYVKLPVPENNLVQARNRFTTAMSTGLGITFGTICELGTTTCCYAWSPKDRTEQQEHLMGSGLKLSAKTGSSRLTGIAVRNWAQWQFLRLHHRRRSGLKPHLFG
jgi:hypothetical protein